MQVLLIEPYFTGSHEAWAEGLKKNSSHEITILKLPGTYWKWRMQGGAVALAREFLSTDIRPDLILATDMLDLPNFLALTRKRTHDVPVAVYFHENQLNYPWNPDDRDVAAKKEKRYALINYQSALAADAVLFNSSYHKNSFISALPNLLKHFPDHNELDTVDDIEHKSRVLPLGIDLERLDVQCSDEKDSKDGAADNDNSPPLLLWNHRWEYDKRPEEFFNALYDLDERAIKYRLAVVGEHFGKMPECFSEAKERLESKIVHFGFAESFDEYASWLWKADILPVTSMQDFFGISVVEACYCGCIPLLPERLTYPELFPQDKFAASFYKEGELANALEELIRTYQHQDGDRFREQVSRYDWKQMIDTYDKVLQDIADTSNTSE